MRRGFAEDRIFDKDFQSKPKMVNALVDQIKETVNIVEYLEDEYGLVLEENGNGWYRASCPLPGHRDSTPSFGVNPEKGLYKCFGCQGIGDVIGFVRKVDGITFSEAVERLRVYAGLSDNPDEAETIRALRDIKSIADEYLNRQAEYDLPGGISPMQFMRSLSDRLRKFEINVEYDETETNWVDKVYMEADALYEEENYKGMTALWDKLGGIIKEHYANWKEIHPTTTTGSS